MAIISDTSNNQIHLKKYHLFGRLHNAVDTYLADPTVSRLHFSLEYSEGTWYLVDYSKNGTWVNRNRVTKNEKIPLEAGDSISVCGEEECTFTLVQVGTPLDMLCRRNSEDSPILETTELKVGQLDCAEAKEPVQVGREAESWVIQHPDNKQVLSDGGWVSINDSMWQACINLMSSNTLELDTNKLELKDLKLQLNTSFDEENISGKIISYQGQVDLPVRSHNYLLLLLSRQRLQDQSLNIDSTECGWVYMDNLMQMLGVSETFINIQIYRARKQMEALLDNMIEGKQIIERRAGQVRIGFSTLSVYKGKEVEYA